MGEKPEETPRSDGEARGGVEVPDKPPDVGAGNRNLRHPGLRHGNLSPKPLNLPPEPDPAAAVGSEAGRVEERLEFLNSGMRWGFSTSPLGPGCREGSGAWPGRIQTRAADH